MKRTRSRTMCGERPKCRKRLDFSECIDVFDQRDREKKLARRKRQLNLEFLASCCLVKNMSSIQRKSVLEGLKETSEVYQVPLLVKTPQMIDDFDPKPFEVFLKDLSKTFPDLTNNTCVGQCLDNITAPGFDSVYGCDLLDLDGSIDSAIDLSVWSANKGYDKYFYFHHVKRGQIVTYIITFTLTETNVLFLDPGQTFLLTNLGSGSAKVIRFD